jgi:hypothetical protein
MGLEVGAIMNGKKQRALTRTELESLADRLGARGESRLLSDQPEMRRDLTLAATELRAFARLRAIAREQGEEIEV